MGFLEIFGYSHDLSHKDVGVVHCLYHPLDHWVFRNHAVVVEDEELCGSCRR
jgi:hypothetical protein